MGKKRVTTEQIIMKLREMEVLTGQGETVLGACRKVGISEQTFYRWRREYGGLKMGQAKRLKDLETGNRHYHFTWHHFWGLVNRR